MNTLIEQAQRYNSARQEGMAVAVRDCRARMRRRWVPWIAALGLICAAEGAFIVYQAHEISVMRQSASNALELYREQLEAMRQVHQRE